MRCSSPIGVSIKSAGDVVHVPRRHSSFPYVGRRGFLVPCGKCLACKSRRKSQATARIDFERRYGHLRKLKDGSQVLYKFKHCFFVTLTYAPDFVPYKIERVFRNTGEVVSTPTFDEPILNPFHLRDFLKRFRRYLGDESYCKYFAVGEYGDSFDRPHYHLILHTDLSWEDCRLAVRHAWSVKASKKDFLAGKKGVFVVDGKYKTYRLSFGRVQLKPVNMRRIRYVAKYIVKDNNSSMIVPKFALLSHFLGSGYLLSKDCADTKKSGLLFGLTVDGKPCSLGRYFLHRMYTKQELQSVVWKYVLSTQPPVGEDVGKAYKDWFDEMERKHSAEYRMFIARQKIPRLVYT